MVREAGVVVAEDPRPVEPGRHFEQKAARLIGQAVAAEAVVEAVAKTVELLDSGRLDDRRQGRERGDRIVGREELAEPREPACLFKVQVGHQQRLLRRPVKRTFG